MQSVIAMEGYSLSIPQNSLCPEEAGKTCRFDHPLAEKLNLAL